MSASHSAQSDVIISGAPEKNLPDVVAGGFGSPVLRNDDAQKIADKAFDPNAADRPSDTLITVSSSNDLSAPLLAVAESKSPFNTIQSKGQVGLEGGLSMVTQATFNTAAKTLDKKFVFTMDLLGLVAKLGPTAAPMAWAATNNVVGNAYACLSSVDTIATLKRSGNGNAWFGFAKEMARYVTCATPPILAAFAVRELPVAFGGEFVPNTVVMSAAGSVLFQGTKAILHRYFPETPPVPRNDDNWKSIFNWIQWLATEPVNRTLLSLSLEEMLRYTIEMFNEDCTSQDYFPLATLLCSITIDSMLHYFFTPDPFVTGMFTPYEQSEILKQKKFKISLETEDGEIIKPISADIEVKIIPIEKQSLLKPSTGEDRDTIRAARSRVIAKHLIIYGAATTLGAVTCYFWDRLAFLNNSLFDLGNSQTQKQLTDQQKLTRAFCVQAGKEGIRSIVAGSYMLFSGGPQNRPKLVPHSKASSSPSLKVSK